MKVEHTNLPKAFQPSKLSITIENEDDLRILRRLFGSDVSVPAAVYDNGVFPSSDPDRATLSKMLRAIHSTLQAL